MKNTKNKYINLLEKEVFVANNKFYLKQIINDKDKKEMNRSGYLHTYEYNA